MHRLSRECCRHHQQPQRRQDASIQLHSVSSSTPVCLPSYSRTSKPVATSLMHDTGIPMTSLAYCWCLQRRPRGPGRCAVQSRHASVILRHPAPVLQGVTQLYAQSRRPPKHELGLQEHRHLLRPVSAGAPVFTVVVVCRCFRRCVSC